MERRREREEEDQAAMRTSQLVGSLGATQFMGSDRVLLTFGMAATNCMSVCLHVLVRTGACLCMGLGIGTTKSLLLGM